MTTPALAICLPVGTSPGAAPPYDLPWQYALRSVAALAAQTCRDFEVVVALDVVPTMTDDEIGQRSAAMRAVGATTVVHVKRGADAASLAHRNHCRNAAWRAASAPLCLMLDADFILPPHAVDAILAEHRRLFAAGVPAIMSPALGQFGGVSDVEWLAASGAYSDWADDYHGGAHPFVSFLARWSDIDRGVFSGFGHLAGHPSDAPAPGSVMSTSVGAAMLEGMPILPRKFLEHVGGFDESYIGWGGDKISLVDVLRGMCAEGIMELRVLHAVLAMHQPHATDPHNTSDGARKNEHRRQLARMEIDARNLPWRRRVPALGKAMHDGWKDCAARLGLSALSMDDPEARPPSEVIAGVVAALKSPRLAGQRAVVIGHDAVTRACAGQIRGEVGKGALGTTEAGAVTLVIVSPFVTGQFEDDATKNATIDGLRDGIRRTATSGSVVVVQRLADMPTSGRSPPGYLRPVDMQDRLVRVSTGAQVIRAAGQTWALVMGRI